jgi:hypothetical protein
MPFRGEQSKDKNSIALAQTFVQFLEEIIAQCLLGELLIGKFFGKDKFFH